MRYASRIMRGLVFVLALVGAGCNGQLDCDGAYTVGDEFTDAEVESFRSAAERWRAFSGREVSIERGDGEFCHVRRVGVIDSRPEVASRWEPWSGNILVARRAEAYGEFENAFLHEFGHSMGLKHVRDPDAIMHWAIGVRLTDDDWRECERVGACRSPR